MPLLLDKKIANHTRVAVWKVEEPNSFFIEALGLDKEELAAYNQMRAHRQKEWLSSRYLLHLISSDDTRCKVVKTENGKPFRKNGDYEISISHSQQYTAVIISPKLVGLDIQTQQAKITRIAHKFVSNKEALRIPEQEAAFRYHILWGAKEAMYKAYGLRELDFKQHMHVFPFILSESEMELKGFVSKKPIYQLYNLYVQQIEDCFLVMAVLDKEETL